MKPYYLKYLALCLTFLSYAMFNKHYLWYVRCPPPEKSQIGTSSTHLVKSILTSKLFWIQEETVLYWSLFVILAWWRMVDSNVRADWATPVTRSHGSTARVSWVDSEMTAGDRHISCPRNSSRCLTHCQLFGVSLLLRVAISFSASSAYLPHHTATN